MKSSKLLVQGCRILGSRQVVHGSSSTSVNGNISHDAIKDWSDIPGPSGLYNIPVLGAMLQFKPFTNHVPEKFHLLIDDLHEEFGPIVRVKLGRWRVLVEDLNDIQTVFFNEGKYPNRPGVPVSMAYGRRRNVRNGLENLSGEDWEGVRKPCSISLSRPHSALPYLSRQNEVAVDFARRITENSLAPVDLNLEFFKYATESTGMITYNTRQGFLSGDGDEEQSKFLRYNEELMEIVNHSIMGRTPLVQHFQTPIYKRYEKINDYLIGVVSKHVNKQREEMKRKKEEGTFDDNEANFLHSLFTNTKLSPADINTLLHNFVVAGTDSTAKNLQLLFYNMAMNKDKQEKLYQEIITVLGPDATITPDGLNKMTFLKACIKESFRLHYPTSSGTLRILPNDIVLSGYRIPKGTDIILCNQRLAKNPEIFDEPEKYKPERWLRDVCGTRRMPIPPMAVLPFGFGPRNCVGRRFAEQELYLAAIQVLHRSQVELAEGGENIEVEYTMFISTKDPIPLIFKKRPTQF